eukprot:Nk52_evm1s274 gene=Nk52_evmTU1s274
MAIRLLRLANEFNIASKINMILGDGASNNTTLQEFLNIHHDLKGGFAHLLFPAGLGESGEDLESLESIDSCFIKCLAHRVNTMLEALLEGAKDDLKPLHSIVNDIKNGHYLQDIYKTEAQRYVNDYNVNCRGDDEPPMRATKLMQRSDTRWEGELECLESLIKMEEVVKNTITRFNQLCRTNKDKNLKHKSKIPDRSWFIAKGLLPILYRCFECTKACSGGFYPTMSTAIIMVQELLNTLKLYEKVLSKIINWRLPQDANVEEWGEIYTDEQTGRRSYKVTDDAKYSKFRLEKIIGDMRRASEDISSSQLGNMKRLAKSFPCDTKVATFKVMESCVKRALEKANTMDYLGEITQAQLFVLLYDPRVKGSFHPDSKALEKSKEQFLNLLLQYMKNDDYHQKLFGEACKNSNTNSWGNEYTDEDSNAAEDGFGFLEQSRQTVYARALSQQSQSTPTATWNEGDEDLFFTKTDCYREGMDYLDSPPVQCDSNFNIAEYFQNYSSRPCLQPFVLMCLEMNAVPAGSVSAERVFSVAGNFQQDRRHLKEVSLSSLVLTQSAIRAGLLVPADLPGFKEEVVDKIEEKTLSRYKSIAQSREQKRKMFKYRYQLDNLLPEKFNDQTEMVGEIPASSSNSALGNNFQAP